MLLIVMLLIANATFACSVCVGKPLKIAFQDAEMFFVGTVASQAQASVTFVIRAQFKGTPASEVTLSNSSSCSMSRFIVGETYLVEATPEETTPHLRAYLCSHTMAAADNDRTVNLVRRRARWWQTPLSRVSWYRFSHFAGRAFA
ncbi:MAG TPA: hypothetical protein VND45_11950 [Thermoanaerobaculia bacterium]|nr:hypothetical protein [Thermoanaerobaculia bacterium]